MLPKQAKVTEDTEILWKSGRGDVFWHTVDISPHPAQPLF